MPVRFYLGKDGRKRIRRIRLSERLQWLCILGLLGELVWRYTR